MCCFSQKSIYSAKLLFFSGEVPSTTEKTESIRATKTDRTEVLDPQRKKEMDTQAHDRISRSNENTKNEEQERQEALPDIEQKMDDEKLTSYGDLQLGKDSDYRSDKKEGNDYGSDAWVADHTAHTPNGSLVMGVLHLDDNKPDPDNDPKAKALLEQKVLSQIGETAMNALKEGKKVVFLAEGKKGGEENTEQRTIAEALDKQFPGQILQSTWDNEAVNVFTTENGEHQGINTKSPIVQKLAAKYAQSGYEGSVVVEAGLWAMMHGQGEELNLSDKAAEFLRQKCGIEVDSSKTDQTDQEIKKALGKATFEGDGVLADVTNDYNRLRQENLLKMISDIESDKQGGIAIVTPGASHAYSLKGVLEHHMDTIKR